MLILVEGQIGGVQHLKERRRGWVQELEFRIGVDSTSFRSRESVVCAGFDNLKSLKPDNTS